MLEAWIALAQALIYLCAVPVNLALVFDSRAGLKFGAGLSAFDPAAARGKAFRRLGRRGIKGRGRKRRVPVRFAWRFLRRLRLDRLSLRGTLALSDAASTALLSGGANALVYALGARARRVEAAVRPDYSASGERVALRGMASARSGQIMLALTRAGLEAFKGRTDAWIESIRLKA